METYLETHPFVRWSLILFLLVAIGAEVLLISSAVTDEGRTGGVETPLPEGGGDVGPTPVILACTVAGQQLNLRSGPSVEFNPPLTQLAPGVSLTAIGRSGDVPWLHIRLANGQEGWVSSRDADGQALVQCEGELQSLPEQGPDLSAADQPEADATPTSEAAPVRSAVRLREGNGPDLHAVRRTFAIALDGELSEWSNTSAAPIDEVVFLRENWAGPDDLSGTVRAAWDDTYLYLAAQVTDDRIVQESEQSFLIRGDALEFFWDANLGADFDLDDYNEDEVQAVMSPGNFAGRAPSAWVYVPQNDNFNSEISVMAQRTGAGYNLEIRLPWERLNAAPAGNEVYGYAIALSDDDSEGSGEQETQLSTTPRLPYPHPTHWGNFFLDP